MAALKYWVWLSMQAVAKTAQRLLEHFSSPEEVFFADKSDYSKVTGITEREITRLEDKNLSAARMAMDRCTQLGVSIMTINDASYPERLRNIFDPPAVLYVKGTLPHIDEEPVVAIVGTRECTPYGVRAAKRIGFELAQSGCIVASGLARGIDTAAAEGALGGDGLVLGVIGNGIDIIYPPENGRLYARVADNGALISEYPPGSPAYKSHFPARNRLLSGLSSGVTVVEAPRKSGALITASRALEQGRDIFAVPGNIDSPACEGSNELLREGAMAAISGTDIAGIYAAQYPDRIRKPTRRFNEFERSEKHEKSAQISAPVQEQNGDVNKKVIDIPEKLEYIDVVKLAEGLSDDEKSIVMAIGTEKMHADEIVRASGIASHRVLSILTMLEISGTVTQLPGKYFMLRK